VSRKCSVRLKLSSTEGDRLRTWTRNKSENIIFPICSRPRLFVLAMVENSNGKKKNIPKQETHKMEIEKHYTSNCEKIVKCGWQKLASFQLSLSPPHPFFFLFLLRPTSERPVALLEKSGNFHFVALLSSISHSQGATLDIA
jgi:hypothetical protein